MITSDLCQPVQMLIFGSWFTEWAKQYGGLYSLKLGTATAVVITDRRIIKELADKRSAKYSNRPASYVSHAYRSREFKNTPEDGPVTSLWWYHADIGVGHQLPSKFRNYVILRVCFRWYQYHYYTHRSSFFNPIERIRLGQLSTA